MAGNFGFDELKRAVKAGTVDTVIVAMVDMQGRLVGKRFQAEYFVDSAHAETHACDYLFFAGWRSDPFCFDTLGALNNLQFTGDDFFADKDVCSIVLEVPNSILGPKEVGLWARMLIPATSAGGDWV